MVQPPSREDYEAYGRGLFSSSFFFVAGHNVLCEFGFLPLVSHRMQNVQMQIACAFDWRWNE
jgi:hypothetical protein